MTAASFRASFRLASLFVIVMAPGSQFALAQSWPPPGSLSSTNTTVQAPPPPAPCTYSQTRYSWTFTDSKGVHTFPGSSVVAVPITRGRCYPFTESLDVWSTDGLYYLQATGGSGAVTGAAGYVNPKYIVVGVTYAPPGHLSNVTYTESTSLGTTVNHSSSFTSAFSESVSITAGMQSECQGGKGGSILGFAGGVCVTGTQSSEYSQGSTSSNSITLLNKASIQNRTTGTPDDFNPVNHDYDIVWLWLNPIAAFSIYQSSPSSIQSNGYGYDMSDQPAMDVWPVLLGYLNGDFHCLANDPNCDPEDARVLARSWAEGQSWPSGEGPGLTTVDLSNIAKADPWGANPSYTVTLAGVSPPTTMDGRFTIVPVSGADSQSFDYKQAGPGNGSGLTQTYTNENTMTTTISNGSNYMTQEAFGVEVKVGGSFFWQTVQFDFKQSSTFTWTHSNLSTSTTISDSTDSLSITGPPCPANPGPCSPQYSGFPEFDVYQDNFFGTFMFWGVN